MCFSAPVSFTASAVLATIGTALVVRVKLRRLLPLALIPLIFAVQQFAEGMVWLHLSDSMTAKNIYLFFAYFLWPIWLPFSLWLPEKNVLKKQILAICLGIGLVIGLLLSVMIPQTTAVVHHSSIHYFQHIKLNQFDPLIFFFYGISTIAPFFFSSIKKIWVLGILVAVAGFFTYFVDCLFFVSVWCFCSALLSLYLFFVLKNTVRKK